MSIVFKIFITTLMLQVSMIAGHLLAVTIYKHK